jgi:gamma-tubulin complex component 4
VSLLESLYEQLSSSTRQGFGADTSIDVSTTMMGTPGPDGRRTRDIDTEMRRHIERLLLRLDFNGAVSKWRSETTQKTTEDILPQGGLA